MQNIRHMDNRVCAALLTAFGSDRHPHSLKTYWLVVPKVGCPQGHKVYTLHRAYEYSQNYDLTYTTLNAKIPELVSLAQRRVPIDLITESQIRWKHFAPKYWTIFGETRDIRASADQIRVSIWHVQINCIFRNESFTACLTFPISSRILYLDRLLDTKNVMHWVPWTAEWEIEFCEFEQRMNNLRKWTEWKNYSTSWRIARAVRLSGRLQETAKVWCLSRGAFEPSAPSITIRWKNMSVTKRNVFESIPPLII